MTRKTTAAAAIFLSLLISKSRTTESVDPTVVVEVEEPLKFDDIVDRRFYDKMRPPKPGGNPTKVMFHVTVLSLDSINEGSMTYAADIFFGQSWNDHRLKLPANMTQEYRLLPVEWLQDIWRPDSFFKNAKQVTFQRMTIPNHYLWLYKSKQIMYMVKLTLLLSCSMKFNKYPHDEQLCRLSVESISHTTDDLVFEWLPDEEIPLVVEPGIELPQLELISNYTADCTAHYSTGNFTCLEVVFKLRRRLGYFMFHTYIPTCLIVMMSWISFWIKPEAVPARVTLGVTSLLTLSTQHANSQKSLPPVSYIKAIDMFMSSCTFFVFFSLIEYAFVNVMMGDISEIERKDRGGSRAQAAQQKLLKSLTNCANTQDHIDLFRETPLHTNQQHAPNPQEELQAKIEEGSCPRHSQLTDPRLQELYFRQNGGGILVTKHKPKDSKEIMKKRREKAICIDRVSRVLFPSTFVLLNIIYWLVFSDILVSIAPGLDDDEIP